MTQQYATINTVGGKIYMEQEKYSMAYHEVIKMGITDRTEINQYIVDEYTEYQGREAY